MARGVDLDNGTHSGIIFRSWIGYHLYFFDIRRLYLFQLVEIYQFTVIDVDYRCAAPHNVDLILLYRNVRKMFQHIRGIAHLAQYRVSHVGSQAIGRAHESPCLYGHLAKHVLVFRHEDGVEVCATYGYLLCLVAKKTDFHLALSCGCVEREIARGIGHGIPNDLESFIAVSTTLAYSRGELSSLSFTKP